MGFLGAFSGTFSFFRNVNRNYFTAEDAEARRPIHAQARRRRLPAQPEVIPGGAGNAFQKAQPRRPRDAARADESDDPTLLQRLPAFIRISSVSICVHLCSSVAQMSVVFLCALCVLCGWRLLFHSPEFPFRGLRGPGAEWAPVAASTASIQPARLPGKASA